MTMFTTCKKCGGLGVIAGNATIKCPACDGFGKIIKGECPACGGVGTVTVETEILCQDCEGSGLDPSADPRD